MECFVFCFFLLTLLPLRHEMPANHILFVAFFPQGVAHAHVTPLLEICQCKQFAIATVIGKGRKRMPLPHRQYGQFCSLGCGIIGIQTNDLQTTGPLPTVDSTWSQMTAVAVETN